MTKLFTYATCLAAVVTASASYASTYYVDSVYGHDSSSGITASQAWQTLGKVNTEQLKPGDRLLFRAGETFCGHLKIDAQGTRIHNISIDRYGNGTAPEIVGGGIADAVNLTNCSYLTLQNLAISNLGATRQSGRLGVKLVANDGTTCRKVVLKNLYIHDVNGSLIKAAGGGAGINWSCLGTKHARFDGLTITGCLLARCDRNGITGSGYGSRSNWYPSLHVLISHNTLVDTGGDGIVPVACDGCIVEYNVVRDSGLHLPPREFAAGIWPFASDNTIIQFNEVSGQHGIAGDAQGYDADWNCRNTLIQYNYSHDNEGGFLLVCDDGSSGSSYSVGNVNPVIRYNLSVDDGYRLGNMSPSIHIAGPCTGTRIYNNTIVMGIKPADSLDNSFLRSNSWNGFPVDTLFENNIIYSPTTVAYHLSTHVNTRFSNNLYFGKQINMPTDDHAILANPLFTGQLTAVEGSAFANGFRLRDSSPAATTGRVIANNGGRDLIGRPLPTTGVSLGALQLQH